MSDEINYTERIVKSSLHTEAIKNVVEDTEGVDRAEVVRQ